MATFRSFFTTFFSFLLLLLLFHLGCFHIFASAAAPTDRRLSPTRKRKGSPVSCTNFQSPSRLRKARKALSSSWSSLRGVFTTSKFVATAPTLTSARSSHHSLVSLAPPETHLSDLPIKPCGSCHESDISADNPFLPLRNDIFPCTACGEIFPKPHMLEQHQSVKHAVSEMTDADAGKNIVQIIFRAGWGDTRKRPEIRRILRIHNSPKILARFEEYREIVKSKASRNGVVGRRDERCIADGNELLRFHCSMFSCDLGQNGNSSICNQPYCSVCGIIKSGFSPKMDGISTLSDSWRAHVAIPDDVEEEFGFMNVKRAMLVCRVVAGRIGCEADEAEKEDGGFDSVTGRGGGGAHARLDEEELIVFNPRAVLPCFVIVYTV